MNDWGLAARFLVALAIVLALIAAATWFARRYLSSGIIGNLGGRRRLSVVEYAMLDGKSRLVLVRRDETEHLLVLGPSGAVVVESGIQDSGRGAAAPREAGVSAATGSSRDASRPPFRSLITGRQ
jgi:flagellar protein FliO/FliZ